jgi:hypothetical protein
MRLAKPKSATLATKLLSSGRGQLGSAVGAAAVPLLLAVTKPAPLLVAPALPVVLVVVVGLAVLVLVVLVVLVLAAARPPAPALLPLLLPHAALLPVELVKLVVELPAEEASITLKPDRSPCTTSAACRAAMPAATSAAVARMAGR